jgi:hypothetical protein
MMERFLDGDFDPVTNAWGFLETSFSTATSFFDTWLMTIRKATGRSFQGSIREALTTLGVRSAHEVPGTPLPFEATEQYRVRVVQKRFPPELLVSYCRHFGVDVFDPAFYGPVSRSIVAA